MSFDFVATPSLSLCAHFQATYRELKRLDSISRSPLYALFGETIDGVATIRAYGAQGTLYDRLGRDLDKQQHAYYLTCASQCWLAIRLELVGTLVITFACLCSVLQHGKMGGNETFAGLAGLSISFSLSVTQSLNWAVRMASDFEANMVSVERIEQYCMLPSEAPRQCDMDKSLSSSWPSSGQVDFVQTKLRYRPGLPLILKGLDIHIPGRSKVGVVGRTGAGKSTLMAALLRIVELDSGKILIDGVDIRCVGLAKLRSKIAVVPQDPVLFSVSQIGFDLLMLTHCMQSKYTYPRLSHLHRARFERTLTPLKNTQTLASTMYCLVWDCILQHNSLLPIQAFRPLLRIQFNLSTMLYPRVGVTFPSANGSCW